MKIETPSLLFFYEISSLLKSRTNMLPKKKGELKPSTLSFKTKEGIEEMWTLQENRSMVPDYLH